MTFPVLPSNTSGCYVPTGKKLTNSLRTRNSANGYLNRTPASASNRQTWTYSAWVKRGLLGASTYTFFYAGSTSAGQLSLQVYFSGDTLSVLSTVAGVSNDLYLTTTQVFRDPSAWYHIVIAVDTTQATASNRAKIYVNGTQVTSFTNSTYPAQNYQTALNNTVNHNISNVDSLNIGASFDGYTAELNVIDGQALSPTSFGQFDPVTGVWVPINYTGTYGTNGFYLPFTDTTSPTTLGYDFSGNGNNWTPNNISTTAGSTYDSMTDVPTLTSSTQANYCVLNPLNSLGGSVGTLSNGNLQYYGPTNIAGGTFQIPTTGKWYFECSLSSAQFPLAGLAKQNAAGGGTNTGWFGAYYNGVVYDVFYDSSYTNAGSSSGFCETNGDIFLCCIDSSNNKVWFGRNRSGTITWIGGGDPASGTNPTVSGSGGGGVYATNFDVSAGFYPAVSSGAGSDVWNANFGQQPFAYTPPAGFLPLNTFNLPCPTIWNGANVMEASLWTGNTTGQSISNAITGSTGFKPDFVWIKQRNSTNSHVLIDSVRGNNQVLYSNLTSAESTATAGTGITAFNTNGFTLGTEISTNGSTNAGGQTYVGWQWNAGNGVTSTNTNGSITSTVSVNPTAGFSIVTYTGTGANATVGHGLGVAPKMIIVKNRSGVFDWRVYVESIGAGNILLLNTTAASTASAASWNSTAPTSTVFSLGTAPGINTNTNNFVAYCWAAIPGYSAFGSYTGNGSGDGPFIYTGFRPRFIMIKNISSNWNWVMMDTSRAPYNPSTSWLLANTVAAEYTDAYIKDDFVSNGFKIRNIVGQDMNGPGDNYIYMAFAENPFKYANAR